VSPLYRQAQLSKADWKGVNGSRRLAISCCTIASSTRFNTSSSHA